MRSLPLTAALALSGSVNGFPAVPSAALYHVYNRSPWLLYRGGSVSANAALPSLAPPPAGFEGAVAAGTKKAEMSAILPALSY